MKRLAIVVAVLALAREAAAGDDKSAAQALLTQGNQLVGDGEYVAALERFQAAYARFPSPKILLNQGATLRLLGRPVAAAAMFESYLADPGAEPGKAAEVERALHELDALVARVHVHASEEAAVISVDGRRLDDAKHAVRLDPGEHVIVAERPGFVTAVANVVVAAHDERDVDLKLRRPGEKPIIVVTPARPGATQRATGYVIGAAGIVALNAAVVLALLEKAKSNEGTSECQPSVHFQNAWVCAGNGTATFDAAERLRTAANWASIGGGIAFVAGAALVLTAPDAKKGKPAAHVSVRATPSGVMLGGRW